MHKLQELSGPQACYINKKFTACLKTIDHSTSQLEGYEFDPD